MAESSITFVCSCEDSMTLDGAALAGACRRLGTELRGAEQLCRSQLGRFQAALAEGRPVTVACTQEAPLFIQEAAEAGAAAPRFVNLREAAGWSDAAGAAGPKMAALLAAAAAQRPETPLLGLESHGVALLLGRDATALEAAEQLREQLDLTVLLTGAEPVAPPSSAEYPILRGRARSATGWLGAFEVVVDGHAAASPASRAAFVWGPAKDGLRSRCDLILDLTGNAPLFPHARAGYLRADPADKLAVARLVAAAGAMVGTFDKPRFIAFEAGLCAHSRNKRTGCTRCIELCPTGAITPGKDSVQVSAEICEGCGACAAVCPTGAATYALPPPADLLGRLRALMREYRAAGGADPVLLLHDATHGWPMIEALARHGSGLPAQVIPFAVNAISQLDLAALAAPLAWGAAGLRLLLPARRAPEAAGVLRNLETLAAALDGLGLQGPLARAAAIETDDPFTLAEALAPALALALPLRSIAAAEFLALGTGREVLRQAWRALHAAAGASAPAQVPLPAGAPFGEAHVAAEGCTLCLACTMVCPTGAFSANPESPELRFLEEACVQCGLCVATCPEKVISLVPRLDFSPEAAAPRTVKAEAPALCQRCAKPFGMASSIARVKAKLTAGGHWMFQDPARLAVLDLCEDCRVFAATDGGIDPHAGPPRPPPRVAGDA